MQTSGAYRAYGSDDIVTGEGVEIELPIATTPMRMASALIDVLLTLVVYYFSALLLTFLLADASGAMLQAFLVLFVVGLFIGLPTTLETLTRGRTVGKLALGTRTVRDDGGPISFRQALTRALIGFVEIYLFFGLPALVASMLSTRSKRLGDMAAGTYVAKQRVRLRLTPPPEMPPALAAWVANADIGGLPPGLAVAVRQYLARAAMLTPQARAGLGGELVAEVLVHVAPPPPPGAPGDLVLAAVIAERRRRDHDRLVREGRLRAQVTTPDPLRPHGPS